LNYAKPTSPFGPNSNCAPLTFRSSIWTAEPPDAWATNETSAPPRLSSRENGSDPRPGQMTPSHKNDIFHVVDSHTTLLGGPHAVIDVVDHSFSEISESDSVLPFGWERKI
jgi:hypothetical protein